MIVMRQNYFVQWNSKNEEYFNDKLLAKKWYQVQYHWTQ